MRIDPLKELFRLRPRALLGAIGDAGTAVLIPAALVRM